MLKEQNENQKVNILEGVIRFGILYTNKHLPTLLIQNQIQEREKVEYSMCKIENKNVNIF